MHSMPLGRPNPFLAAHAGLMPLGDVAVLGAGNGSEIVYLARKGYAITVFEQDEMVLAQARSLALSANVTARWQLAPRRNWQLGFERWVGIVALFPRWNMAEQRRLLRVIPSALQPGGSFLFEGYAESPTGPVSLCDDEHDPEEFQCALDVLHLSRCARVARPPLPGTQGPGWVLQVAGSHLEADDELPLAASPSKPLAKSARSTAAALN